MLINSILKASSIFKNKQYQQKLAGIAANSGICKNNNILKNVKPPINLTFSGGKINLDEKVINSITNKTLKDPYQQAYTGYIYSCVEALNSSNPKELVFLIDNKTGECIAKAAGDAVSCSFEMFSAGTPAGDHGNWKNGEPAEEHRVRNRQHAARV